MKKPKAEKSKDRRKKKLTKKNNNYSSWDDSQDLNVQLRRLNLCTKDITGDGNCLFRSLSDQYYGRDSQHKSIREEICTFLEEHEKEYKFFVEDDIPFEKHVSDMKCNGTFGGNMELAAFARLKKVDIKVYQPGLIYIINGTDSQDDEVEEEEKQILHIAYHSWEHYSSIRNIDGPATGPPEIKVTQKEGDGYIDEDNDEDGDNNTKKEDPVDIEKDSKEKTVLSACPNISPRRIKRLLIKHKGDVDKVIDLLYEEMNKSEENTTATATIEKDSSKTDKSAESTTELTEPIGLSEATTKSIGIEKNVDQVHSGEISESVEVVGESIEATFDVDILTEKYHRESLNLNEEIKPDNIETKASMEKEDEGNEKTKEEENGEKEEKEEEEEEEEEEIVEDDEEEKEKKNNNKEKANKGTQKPKKSTARQRKLEAKKRQKELQAAKKRAKEERKTKRAQGKPSDDTTDDMATAIATKNLPSAMKELYI